MPRLNPFFNCSTVPRLNSAPKKTSPFFHRVVASVSSPLRSRVRLIGPLLLALFVLFAFDVFVEIVEIVSVSQTRNPPCPPNRVRRKLSSLACTQNPPFASYPKSDSCRRTQNPIPVVRPKIRFLSSDPKSDSCRDPKSGSSRRIRNPILVVAPNSASSPTTQNPNFGVAAKSSSPPTTRNPTLVVAPISSFSPTTRNLVLLLFAKSSSSPTTRNPTLVVAKSDSSPTTRNPTLVVPQIRRLLPRPEIRFLSRDPKPRRLSTLNPKRSGTRPAAGDKENMGGCGGAISPPAFDVTSHPKSTFCLAPEIRLFSWYQKSDSSRRTQNPTRVRCPETRFFSPNSKTDSCRGPKWHSSLGSSTRNPTLLRATRNPTFLQDPKSAFLRGRNIHLGDSNPEPPD